MVLHDEEMSGSRRRTLELTERKLLLVAMDLLLLWLSIEVSISLWMGWDSSRSAVSGLSDKAGWLLLMVLWVAIGSLIGLYELRAAAVPARSLRGLALAGILIVAGYAFAYFFAPRQSLPRSVFLVHVGTSLVLLGTWRIVYARLFSRPSFLRRLLVVGAGDSGRALVRLIQSDGSSLYSIDGFVDDDPAKLGSTVLALPVLGQARDVAQIVSSRGVGEVVVAITTPLQPEVLAGLLLVQEEGVQITPMALLYESLTGQVPVSHVGEHWYVALPLHHPQTRVGYSLVKRAFDCTLALSGLALLMFLLPIAALAIKVNSEGPIFYRQVRVGKHGRPFKLFKLRTMIANAEPEGVAVWAKAMDPRVTGVGKVLRATMMDEMPQLWNVLKGEMSIVGPRPERPELVSQLEGSVPYYRLRHAVAPGMAGWALLHGGYSGSAEEALSKVQYDLYYIKHQSLWLDMQIVLRTIGRALTFRRFEAPVDSRAGTPPRERDDD